MPSVSFRKVGGIWFWRVWRIGGSFYLKKASPRRPTHHRTTVMLDRQAMEVMRQCEVLISIHDNYR